MPPPLTASAGAAQASTVASAQAASGTRSELPQESCGVSATRARRWTTCATNGHLLGRRTAGQTHCGIECESNLYSQWRDPVVVLESNDSKKDMIGAITNSSLFKEVFKEADDDDVWGKKYYKLTNKIQSN